MIYKKSRQRLYSKKKIKAKFTRQEIVLLKILTHAFTLSWSREDLLLKKWKGL